MADFEDRRPYPPANFTGENWLPYTRIIPASEISEWVNQHILSEEGRIHNPDHIHLRHIREEGALCPRSMRAGNAPCRWLAEGQNGAADA